MFTAAAKELKRGTTSGYNESTPQRPLSQMTLKNFVSFAAAAACGQDDYASIERK
jgi:hypothetical protein